ncbi:MAG: O-antigen ligase family protein [Chloroflexi bacterium]|nr:O-antigen ligase family protein [Chloroflexota bacterium]
MAHRSTLSIPSAERGGAALSTGADIPWLRGDEAAVIVAAGAALGAFYLAPWPAVAALAAAAFLGLAVRMPLAGVIWVLWTAPWYRFPKVFDAASFGPLAGGRTASVEIAVVEAALLLTVAAWGLRAVVGGGRGPLSPGPFPPILGARGEGRGTLGWAWWRSSLVSPLGLLLVAATVAAVFAEHQREAWREYRTVIVEPALLGLVLRDLLRFERHRLVLLHAFVVLGAFVGVQGVVRYSTGAEATEAEGVWRAGAIYWSANHLALLFDRLTPIAVALALFAPVSARWRALYAAAGLAQGATVLLTFSKAGWLALGTAVAALGLARDRRVALTAALVTTVLLAAALVFGPTERLLSAATSSQRIWLWQASLAMLRDHPLTGVGPDNFLYAYHNYMLPEAWREPDLSHPHNLVLDFWLRLGILGTATLAWMLALFARNAWRALRSSGPGWTRAGAAGVGAAMAAAVLHGLVDNSFFLIDLAYLFWALWMMQESFAVDPEARRPVRPTEDGQGSAT